MKSKKITAPDLQSTFELFGNFPVKISEIRHFPTVPPLISFLKGRRFCLLYIKRGQITFDIEGNTLNTSPGNILLLKPGANVHCENPPYSCGIVCFKFSVSDTSELSLISSAFNPHGFFGEKKHLLLNLSPKNELRIVLNKFLCISSRTGKNNNMLSALCCAELFLILSSYIASDSETTGYFLPGNFSDNISRAKDFIDKNFNLNLSVTDVANHIFVSESYLTHEFLKKYNVSPKKYIILRKIEKAKEFLKNSSMSSSEIANATGFSSAQHFNNVFKQCEGVSPLQYRDTTASLSYV